MVEAALKRAGTANMTQSRRSATFAGGGAFIDTAKITKKRDARNGNGKSNPTARA